MSTDDNIGDRRTQRLLDSLTRTHRAARAELREGMAALATAAAKGKLQKDGTRK